jgi:hypothetical protein
LLVREGIEAGDEVLEQILETVKADEFLELTDPGEIFRYLDGLRVRTASVSDACRKSSRYEQLARL